MNNLEKAQYLKKRFDHETWIERKKFFIAKAKAWKIKLKEGCGKITYGGNKFETESYCDQFDGLCEEDKQAIKVLEEIK